MSLGRWTIFVREDGGKALQITHGSEREIPVVPCDDAAIERAARAMYERINTWPWDQSAPAMRENWHKAARAAFRAAGEEDA